MAKIYNEVVIDMNPESSTFEETLYEDSFEYNGDDIILVMPHGGDHAEGLNLDLDLDFDLGLGYDSESVMAKQAEEKRE